MTTMLQDFRPQFDDECEEMRALMQDRERRAFVAYDRSPDCFQEPQVAEHVEHEGREYVVLSADIVGELATYRVRRDGRLKRLKRPPDMRDGARVFELDDED